MAWPNTRPLGPPGGGPDLRARRLTAQLELTITQLWRVRGEAVQPDHRKTNRTSGVMVGYFLLPLRPGLSYMQGLDVPLRSGGYRILQMEVLVSL